MLLFDHNLSPRLVTLLQDAFPGSNHLYNLNLHESDDEVIWSYAQDNRLIIVTKDSDFSEMLVLRGYPPKIVWVRRGNCSTNTIASLLRRHAEDIVRLKTDSNSGLLVIV
jgi:predicted nuclease of predicted toxin-antitoxin system